MDFFKHVPKSDIEILDRIGEAANQIGCTAYVIGGYVRDVWLKRSSKDIDIVTVGSGIRLAERVRDTFDSNVSLKVFKRFGTAQLKALGYEIEFVGARKESYRYHSRKPIVEDGTLEEDQLRRDFTINALSVALNGPERGQLLDPFEGIKDLENRMIRTPRDPIITFRDDPLRILRGIRFATQLGFVIESDTFAGMREVVDRIKIISFERIREEVQKIISSSKPSIGFLMMEKIGLLKIIFPELIALKGVQVINGIGHKDNFYHTLEVLDNVAVHSKDVWLRWSALLHDIGKAPTKRFSQEEGWTFHGHEVVGAKMVTPIFKRFKLPLDERKKYVQKLVRHHLRPISLTKECITDSAIRRLLFDMGEHIDDLMILCEADITSKNERRVKKYLENYQLVRIKLKEVEEKDKLRNWQPPVSGKEIMDTFGLKPSRLVGVIKTEIREAILDGIIPNDKEAAVEFMLEVAKKHDLTPVE